MSTASQNTPSSTSTANTDKKEVRYNTGNQLREGNALLLNTGAGSHTGLGTTGCKEQLEVQFILVTRKHIFKCARSNGQNPATTSQESKS